MAKKKFFNNFASYNAHQQTKAAIALMSIIPALVVAFMSFAVRSPKVSFSIGAHIAILAFTLILAFCGYIVLRKYPENIIRLRRYISELAAGTFPQDSSLLDTQSSDDIRFIENSFNAVLEEMRRKMEWTEKQLILEQELRKTIEQQEQDLVHAEQHRVMIQSLGAACHHIGQPATVLGMHLYLLKENAKSDEDRAEIDQCMEDLDAIGNILKKLQAISRYRTTAYIDTSADFDKEIIDIDAAG